MKTRQFIFSYWCKDCKRTFVKSVAVLWHNYTILLNYKLLLNRLFHVSYECSKACLLIRFVSGRSLLSGFVHTLHHWLAAFSLSPSFLSSFLNSRSVIMWLLCLHQLLLDSSPYQFYQRTICQTLFAFFSLCFLTPLFFISSLMTVGFQYVLDAFVFPPTFRTWTFFTYNLQFQHKALSKQMTCPYI